MGLVLGVNSEDFVSPVQQEYLRFVFLPAVILKSLPNVGL